MTPASIDITMGRNVIFVAIGGMLGSVLRYALSTLVVELVPFTFPFGTLAINLIGCFVMGAAVGYAERNVWFHDAWRVFITAGFCGGFTTFSAFAFENVDLLLDKHYMLFAAYVLASVGIGVAATLGGFILTRN
jgi:CrcB protein